MPVPTDPNTDSQRVALELRRAQLAANLPTDDEYIALQDAQRASNDLAREQQKADLASVEEQLAALDTPAEPA